MNPDYPGNAYIAPSNEASSIKVNFQRTVDSIMARGRGARGTPAQKEEEMKNLIKTVAIPSMKMFLHL